MAIPFVTESNVEYGVATTSSPLIRRIVAKNPSKFTYHGTGTYLIGHGSGVAIVDPGPRDEEHVAAVLGAVDGEEVTHLLITHTHGDHSPAAAAVADATGAKTYGYGPHPANARGEDEPDDDGFLDDPLLHPPVDAEAATDSGDGAEGKSTEEQAAEREKHRPDTDFRPDVPVGHGDLIEGDGWTVECLHTPGHISNHVCFSLREERSLFSGDHVMGWSTTIVPPPDGNMADYFASLELLIGRPETTYYPTHGPRITDPQDFVRALLEHRRERERQILGVMATGPATIGEMVLTMYADVDQALHKPAARSVRSHLDHLEARGLAVHSTDRPPVYSLAG